MTQILSFFIVIFCLLSANNSFTQIVVSDPNFNSADVGFNKGDGPFSGVVNTMAVLSDGKIIAAGSFTSYNFHTQGRIMKLDANGTLLVRIYNPD